MTHPAEQRCVERAAAAGDVRAIASADHLQIEAGERSIDLVLPDDERGWEKLDFRRAFPGRARGDQRETLLAAAIQDAVPAAGTRAPDERLLSALGEAGVLPAADAQTRAVVAEVLADQYWISPRRGGGKSGSSRRPTVFPLHSALPLNFAQRGRYKMFRGDLLLFFCWNGHGFDPEPIERLFGLMNSRAGLSLLDEILIEGAVVVAGEDARTEAQAAGLLGGDQAQKVERSLEAGAYLPRSLARFREDLRAALAMPLPRHDKVSAVILTMSLHLALYYYETAFTLGQDVDRAIRIAGGVLDEPCRSFDGALLFRVGTSGDRPVRRASGCAAAWRELDDRYLIAISANILTSNLLHEIWSAAGGAPEAPDPSLLAQTMGADEDLRSLIDGVARVLAVLFAARAGEGASTEELEEIADSDYGVHTLRQTILRHRARTLKHLSRDVVNQLVKPAGYGGSLVRTRGNVQFFELDEAFLFLLVKFVIARRGGGDAEIPFSDFLNGLSEYGLRPQDRDEQEMLAGALERLGMLHRYSDAGEAVYVHHLL